MTPAWVGSLDASNAVCWRPGRPGQLVPSLYWAPKSRCPVGERVVAFSTDDKAEFAYDAFNPGRDFGPLDIARTVMYCRWVDDLCAAHARCTALVHITSDTNREDQANTAALCGAYLVLAQGMRAEEAFRPFQQEQLRPFLDCRGESASGGAIADEPEEEFELTVLDVLRGLERVRDLGWIDHRTFPAEEHASMLRPEHGDMSWLLPGRALALASPWSEPHDQDGYPVCTPAVLAPYFHRHGVKVLVQCNHPEREEEGDRQRLLCYNPQHFEDRGIKHVHLPFEDGGCPSIDVVLAFSDTVKAMGGCFAVHCRSGLGRTATLIGVYAMRTFGFSARSFIGWARLVRPGTVHGSQQQYLVNLEPHVKLGSLRPLTSLDQVERLRLLPRKELRFWALDTGIQAAQTRHVPEPEIIEMILTKYGLWPPPERKQETTVANRVALAPIQPIVVVPPAAAQQTSSIGRVSPVPKEALSLGRIRMPGASAPAGFVTAAPARDARAPWIDNRQPDRPLFPPWLNANADSGGPHHATAGVAVVAHGTGISNTAPRAGVPHAGGPPLLTNSSLGSFGAALSAARAAVTHHTVQPQQPQSQFQPRPRQEQQQQQQQQHHQETEVARPQTSQEEEDRPCTAGVSGLSKAIASLSTTSNIATDGDALRHTGPAVLTGAAGPEASGGASDADSVEIVGTPEEWSEMLRYLRLLMAVQAHGQPSWEKVRRLAERLRDYPHRSGGPAAPPGRGTSDPVGGSGSEVGQSAEVAALQQVRVAREAAAKEAQAKDGELREALRQAHDLQRECEQLRLRIASEREARPTDHHQPSMAELGRDETKLAQTTRDVQELRELILCRAASQEGFDPTEVDRARRMQWQAAQAQERAARHAAACKEQKEALMRDASTISAASNPAPASAPVGTAARQPLVVPPQAPPQLSRQVAWEAPAALSRSSMPLEEARDVMQRLRSHFQVPQAGVTVAAAS